RADAGRLRGCFDRHLSLEHAHNGHFAARSAIDPLIGVETGERAAGPHVNKSWSFIVVGACIGEIELLRYHRTPAVEEIRADRHDQTSGAEVELGPGDTVTLSICRDYRVVRSRIVAQVSGHPK